MKFWLNPSVFLNFGFLSLTLDYGSGEVVINLDSHGFLPYILCLYPKSCREALS